MLAEPGRDHKNMNYRVGEKVTKSSRFRKKVLAFVSVSITFVFVMATAPLSSVPKATGGWEFYRNPYIAGLWHPPGNETLEGPLKSDHKVVCAYQQTGGRCDLMWCNDAEGTQSRPHYSLGLVHREKNIRGTIMQTSGTARAGSGCALSRRHRFIYIHVLKSAGMTVKGFLKRALCGGIKMPACPPGSDILEIVNCARAIQNNPDLFVFSFVRDPFSRIYSGYSMADKYRKDRPPFTFPEFVNAKRRRRSLSHCSPAHYLPQRNFLFNGKGCPVFDFLGRLESFQEDLAGALKQIGSQELLDYYQGGGVLHANSTAFGRKQKQERLGGDLRNAFQAEGLVRAVGIEYAHDFRLLGYDKTKVPS